MESAKRSKAASGSGYVHCPSSMFMVATTLNTSGSCLVSPAMVTWRSCMASRSADWTFAGARFNSSARTKSEKIGPSFTRKLPLFGLKISAHRISAGSKSGVNWIRLKLRLRRFENAFALRVFAIPGGPIRSRCPPERSAVRYNSTNCDWFTRTLSSVDCTWDAKSVMSETVLILIAV